MNKIFLLSLIFLCFFCKGQNLSDTNSIIFNAKLNTIKFNKLVITPDGLAKIPILLANTLFCKSTILNSQGFNKVIFIKVQLADDILPELLKFSEKELENEPHLKSELGEIFLFDFVVVYSYTRNKFYKIKGFLTNEFDDFFFDYMLAAKISEREILQDKKKILKHYSVDEIELSCLLKSIHTRKIDYDDFPCLRPSDSRLIEINGMRFNP